MYVGACRSGGDPDSRGTHVNADPGCNRHGDAPAL